MVLTWAAIMKLAMALWGISQEEVAEYMGVNGSTISKLINGKQERLRWTPQEIYDRLFEPNKINQAKDFDGEDILDMLEELIGKRVFDYPKDSEILQRLISYVTDKDSIILDFFAGSATTAHAVMQLNAEDGGNRQFICVQLPELADEKSEAFKAGYKTIGEIGKERLRRTGVKLRETDGQMTLGEDRPPLDTGFKVFKLDSSNIKFWDGIPVGVGNGQLYLDNMRKVIDGIKDDRPPLDQRPYP